MCAYCTLTLRSAVDRAAHRRLEMLPEARFAVTYEYLIIHSYEVGGLMAGPVKSGSVAGDVTAARGKNAEDLGRGKLVDPERVASVRVRLIAGGAAEQVAAVFKVLGDPSRCRLIFALIEAGEICVCDLAATLAMSESSVSHHLSVLRANGLVRCRRDGKMIYYAPDDEHISVLLDVTREHVREGREHVREGREPAQAARRAAAPADVGPVA